MSRLLSPGVFALLALGAGVVYQVAGARRDARRWPPRGRRLAVGPGRLHLDQRGQGRPVVVFESGLGASSLSWSFVQPAVARRTGTCSYDRGGLGWSDSRPGRASSPLAAADLRGLLTAAGVAPPYVLVAHSYGSLVARSFLRLFPDDVAGLVLVDPIHPGDWHPAGRVARRRLRRGVWSARAGAVLAAIGVVRFALRRLQARAPRAPTLVVRLFGPEAEALVVRLLGEIRKLPPDIWPALAAIWSRPRSLLSLARQMAALPASAAHAADLEALRDRPVVILAAGDTTPERMAEHERWAARSRRGRVIRAAAGGHWLVFDAPTLIVDAIADVLDAVGTAGSASV